MMFEVPNFIRQQEGVRHEFVIYREESLEPTYNDTENILLGKVVHQWITIEYALSKFYDVQIMVSKCHTVPKKSSITRLICLFQPIFTNDVLDGIKLPTTMICIDYNLRSSYLGLLFSIHYMILMNTIRVPLVT
jgi:hypothetical protein